MSEGEYYYYSRAVPGTLSQLMVGQPIRALYYPQQNQTWNTSKPKDFISCTLESHNNIIKPGELNKPTLTMF